MYSLTDMGLAYNLMFVIIYCVMCCEYAENELQRQWIAVITLILFS